MGFEEDTHSNQIYNNEEKSQFHEAMTVALREFPGMLTRLENPLAGFNKKNYESSFQSLMEEYKEVFAAVDQVWMLAENREEATEVLAKALTAEAAAVIRAETKKRKQEDQLINLNMTMVAYVLPMILECRRGFSDPLADQIVLCWKEEFPKTAISKASFERINSGFKKKYCYITTALCEGLGKPDNCYELTLLRNYRDSYLANQPDGEAVIMEYYNMAPTIVKRMQRETQSSAVYESLYRDYLLPCVRLIEDGRMDECRVLYMDMMQELQKKYSYH